MNHARKSRLALLLSMVLMVGTTVREDAPLAGASAATAVTWSVDAKAKTITVTANLAFFVVPPPESAFQKQRFEARVARAKAAIEKAWNGHSFKCYSLIVKVNARAVSGQQDVRDSEVPVKFDLGVYPVEDAPSKVTRSRSRVYTNASVDDALSDSAQFTPNTGADAQASEWSFEGPGGEYAHEFGHILGLGDNYVEGTWEVKPGAADDIMSRIAAPVSDASITKAVRRSGQVDEKSIKCPLRIDMPKATIGVPGLAAATIELHGCAPDYDPESTDTKRPAKVSFHGKADVTGDANSALPAFGGVLASGTGDFQGVWASPSATLEIPFGGDTLVQAVHASGKGLVSLPQPATLRVPDGSIGLGVIIAITPFAGPCP
jgi:hypothetical protein